MPPKTHSTLQLNDVWWQKSVDDTADDGISSKDFRTRLWVMMLLFSVSLFAASFPTLSKRISYIRIPRIVFFLGKHFGTGVILSTAFVHLLQDAFHNLDHPLVRAKWRIGNYTGMIVLGSLLSIFLVEYISTAYVDRLHSYSSPLPTPPVSPPSSRTPSVIQLQTTDDVCECDSPQEGDDIGEETPLMQSHRQSPGSSYGSTEDMEPSSEQPPFSSQHAVIIPKEIQGDEEDEIFSGGHHRHELRSSHAGHSGRGRKESIIKFADDEEEETVQNNEIHVHDHEHHHHHHHHTHHHHLDHDHEHSHEHGHIHHHAHMDIDHWDPESTQTEHQVKIGQRRQVVGILMLQVGIMIHSLVIGLTLAITSGPEFTSLLTAIIFHQLFEGLSLGIRIAALPGTSHEGLTGRTLKPVLAFTFAITTPIGIALGLGLFGGGRTAGANLKLTQGLMAAISAGMLIYAACVEMLAGDFVMDPLLWRSSLRKQILALIGLLLGATAMAVIG
ncbi:Zinc/iron permease [Abortiporus biennis]|nr:Zinc/iron permease [Abortiporus biennis]